MSKWQDQQKKMSREEIKEKLESRKSVEYVFDPETAVPKQHDMVDRGHWFTCNDCPLRIPNRKAMRMQQS